MRLRQKNEHDWRALTLYQRKHNYRQAVVLYKDKATAKVPMPTKLQSYFYTRLQRRLISCDAHGFCVCLTGALCPLVFTKEAKNKKHLENLMIARNQQANSSRRKRKDRRGETLQLMACSVRVELRFLDSAKTNTQLTIDSLNDISRAIPIPFLYHHQLHVYNLTLILNSIFCPNGLVSNPSFMFLRA